MNVNIIFGGERGGKVRFRDESNMAAVTSRRHRPTGILGS